MVSKGYFGDGGTIEYQLRNEGVIISIYKDGEFKTKHRGWYYVGDPFHKKYLDRQVEFEIKVASLFEERRLTMEQRMFEAEEKRLNAIDEKP